MRRFLVVGCGGSGGATIAYLMDQLRSELGAYGIDRIPRGWQFVNIDVPSAPEPGPAGLGNVREQGGRYIGCAPAGGQYSVLDAAVSNQLHDLNGIATWAPRAPNQVLIPIATGAGQYRAIGRMITLSRADELRQRLTAAWQDLFRIETESEMTHVAQRVPGLGTFDAQADPVILVLSSMAGGAGASMALDVCRVLTLIPGVTAGLTGVFMVSADIFDSLPADSRIGVRANSLAMMGEIVASQSGAATAHDTATLSSLGINVGVGAEVPFGRVFPVGRFMGMDHTMFGDGSPTSVYRGLGRGLAALMCSGKATNDFVAFDLTNTLGIPADQSSLGWGVGGWDQIPWGAFGYSSLSLGRDRYREYAAQRLARGAVDRLMDGHLQPGSPSSPDEQVKALLANLWPAACRKLQLPGAMDNPIDWLRREAFPVGAVDVTVRQVSERLIIPEVRLGTGQVAKTWLAVVGDQLSRRRGEIGEATSRAAYSWAYSWHQEFAVRTYAMVEDAVSRIGLSYAGALVDQLASHLRDNVAPAAARIAGFGPADVTAISPDAQSRVSVIKGQITHAQQVASDLVDSFREPLRQQVLASGAKFLHDGLIAFVGEVLTPLRASIDEGRYILQQARDTRLSTANDAGLAQLSTVRYAAWPSDDDVTVSVRFDNATNDVLLTKSADFNDQFRADLVGAVETSVDALGDYAKSPRFQGQGAVFDGVRSIVAGQIVSGVWPTAGGFNPPRGLLEQRDTWRSKAFAVLPDTGETEVPQPARFDLHIRPEELLARARTFVQRPGESFDRFCSVSLRSFVRGEGATESELLGRRNVIAAAFSQALALARPLASVDADVVMSVHNAPVQYRYKFSDVPFAQLPLAGLLGEIIANDSHIDPTSSTNLSSAMRRADENVTKIDIFGSYANYTPLAFDMVLSPAAEQWASTPSAGRESFWRWRRARPLAAALPMGIDERRTMVAGWFLGQLIGRIRIPEQPFTSAVAIWDPQHHSWSEFPNPLLTSPREFVAPYDWLPAVMESVLLAIARVPQAPVLSSLRPYRLLRELYDDQSQAPSGGILVRSSKGLTIDWLNSGRTSSGDPSRAPGADKADTPQARAKVATDWLGRIRLLSVEFVPSGEGPGSGNGRFATISRRPQAARTPIFRDLAPDVLWATDRLTELVADAMVDIESGIDRYGHPNGGPDDEDKAPDGWTF